MSDNRPILGIINVFITLELLLFYFKYKFERKNPMKTALLGIIFSFFFFKAFSQEELKATDSEALVNFVVSDYSDIPEEGAIINLECADPALSKKGVADINGKFSVLLPEGKDFKMSVFKFNETFDFDTLKIPSIKGLIGFDQQLKIRIVKHYVRTYNLDNLYFDTGKWNIKTESLPPLNALYHALVKNPKMKVEIAGHTDNVGEDVSNMQLSQRRADSVVEWLIAKGINKDRMVAKGYGETAPVASNDIDPGRQKNRRTEVRVIEE